MSYYCVVRGVFLTFAFPYIIDYGRKWWDDGSSPPAAASPPPGAKPLSQRSRRVSAAEDVEAAVTLGLEDTGDAPAAALTLPADEKNSAFDLFFLKWSLVADGCLTGLATFCSQSWEVFVVATLLPLASGSASAAKSVMIEMCPASQKADALSAISLVEMVAALSTREFCECVGSARGGGKMLLLLTFCTVSVFGVVFSELAEVGRPNLVFVCNAAVAVFAAIMLIGCRFPPEGSKRVTGAESEAGSEESRDVERVEESIPRNGK